MSDGAVTEEQPLPAGAFSTWLDEMQGALRGERGSDVPCDGCTACCTSSQFVHIAPDELETLERVPSALLFPAPALPKGNVVLGYDENGHCPMLVDEKCSIYEHRPRTCRTYDCRVFPATGVDVDDDKPAVARRAQRWKFELRDDGDRDRQDAVRAAARFVRDNADLLRETPTNSTHHAVLAIELHEAFLPLPATPRPSPAGQPTPQREGEAS
ncbi:MAG: uncharacterized protein QOD38_1473 [Acidimicrobiaceae bacterium]|jgi:Fe-S-cluster containining protein